MTGLADVSTNPVADAQSGRTLPPLLVFADDWGRHPSSCQHLIGKMLARHDVAWVNTIMRPPRFDAATIRRGWEKSRQWFRKPHRSPSSASGPAPRVINPKMWPWFSSAAQRRLNRWLLSRQLDPVVRAWPRKAIAITTLPIVADLVGQLPVRRWVYYCVDDFSVWPGLDGPALQAMERDLVARVDDIVAVSETLRQKLADMGRSSRLLTHGIEMDFWTGETPADLPSGIANLDPPLILFWGVVDRRMNIDFVRRIVETIDRGTLVLAGPVNDPEPALLKLQRVVSLGPVPFEQLPQLARSASVLVMPYADLPVTRAIQPLKLKEYLATGRPAVVTDLPATRSWTDCLDLASNADEFARLVRTRLSSGLPESQRAARQRLDEESWDAKARDFEGWICASEPEAMVN